jgi:hypothetical protein
MILTKSMVKFDCENFKNNLELLSISKYLYCYLNLEVIIILLLNDKNKKIFQKILRLAKRQYMNTTLLDLDHIITTKEKYLFCNENNTSSSNFFLFKNIKNLIDSYYQYSKISFKLNLSRFKFKIKVKHSALLDFSDIFNEGEIFLQICKLEGNYWNNNGNSNGNSHKK